ncbi:hypothetical protein LZK77_06795 [Rhizobium leguminosarum]|nr:hypothetical protein LZK77_06795 [Rhizobium leguminosarum]
MTVVEGRTSPDQQKAYQDGAYRHGYTVGVSIPRIDLWIAAFLGLRRQDSAVGGVADPSSLGMSPAFAFLCSCALIVVALAANASRLGEGWAVPTFYTAIAAIFLPAAARIIHPGASRLERLALIVIVTSALFVVRLIRAPVAFIDHDEFLHWATVNDILEAGRLFLPNPLLPVSPLYPGLELVTSALVNLSGLSVFAAGLIVLAAARMMLMLTLFLLFEKITNSARIASIACLIYMGSSTFLLFDVHYSYESLAIPMLAAVLLASESRRLERGDTAGWPTVVATMVLIVALAATHHLTSYFCTALLCGTAVMECLRQGASAMQRRQAILLASIAVIAPVAWSKIVGNPTGSYILPVLAGGIHEVAQLVSSSTSTRKLFRVGHGSPGACLATLPDDGGRRADLPGTSHRLSPLARFQWAAPECEHPLAADQMAPMAVKPSRDPRFGDAGLSRQYHLPADAQWVGDRQPHRLAIFPRRRNRRRGGRRGILARHLAWLAARNVACRRRNDGADRWRHQLRGATYPGSGRL